MKGRIMRMFSLMLVVSMLAGCSVLDMAGGARKTEKAAVSGSAAAEIVSSEQSGENRSYKKNSDNWYDVDGDSDENVLIQYRPDGTPVKRIKMDIADVEWVTDDFVYYVTVDNKLRDVLWRIPIRKTGQGDQLQTDQKEKLLKAYSMTVVYATEAYLVLSVWDKDKYTMSRYDCRTGEMTELLTTAEDEGPDVLWGDQYPLMWQGKLLVSYQGEQLLTLVPETGETGSLYAHKGLYIEDYVFTGDDLYFFLENDLYRLRCSKKEMKCVCSEKEFAKAVEKLRPGKETGFEAREMYLDQGRLYFRIYMEYSERDKVSGDKVYYQKDELFHVSIDDPGTIIYEDKLMDYLDRKGYEVNETKSGIRGYYTATIDGIRSGKCIASYGEDVSEQRYILYDLQTGGIEDMAELPGEYIDLLF